MQTPTPNKIVVGDVAFRVSLWLDKVRRVGTWCRDWCPDKEQRADALLCENTGRREGSCCRPSVDPDFADALIPNFPTCVHCLSHLICARSTTAGGWLQAEEGVTWVALRKTEAELCLLCWQESNFTFGLIDIVKGRCGTLKAVRTQGVQRCPKTPRH